METLEALAARLATTGEIRDIVRTMKTLSAVSIHQYERAAAAMESYARTNALGLQAVLRAGRARGAALPGAAEARRAAAPVAVIVIGSDRGLCGRFNDRVAEAAASGPLAGPGAGDAAGPRLYAVGLRAAARLGAIGHPPDAVLALPGSVGGLAGTVRRVVHATLAWREAAGGGALWLVSNRRAGRGGAQPETQRVLPLPRDELAALAARPWPAPAQPFWRSDEAALLSWLLRQRVFTALYRGLADSLAAEHAARLAAMQRAEHNIDDRRDALLAAYRRLRQETVTRELLDVTSGFEAMRGADDGGGDDPGADAEAGAYLRT